MHRVAPECVFVEKTRDQIGPGEIAELDEYLNRRVAAAGLRSQSDLVARILQLNESQTAGFADYAKVIRTDAGLTGRLLKIVNSAFYAQRGPVTSLDRACILLGNERLKAFTLGYYLGNSASIQSCPHSRKIWGESVFRACLSAELARETCPTGVIESFVIGLVMDSGLALMHRLLPGEYEPIAEANLPPHELFEREFQQLPFTHVDVVRALVRMWKLHEPLVTPIQCHHQTPPSTGTAMVERLHRVACIVGQTDCRGVLSPEEKPALLPHNCHDLLRVPDDKLAAAVARATSEYSAAVDLFSGIASKVPNPDALSSRVRTQLSQTIETMLEQGGGGAAEVVERFTAGETRLELRRQSPGWIAYLCDAEGGRLAQVTFQTSSAQVRSIRESLGLDRDDDGLIESMLASARKLAA